MSLHINTKLFELVMVVGKVYNPLTDGLVKPGLRGRFGSKPWRLL